MKTLLTFTAVTLFTTSVIGATPTNFKMAVVQGSDGASDIRKGNYHKGIQQIVSSSIESTDEQVEVQMNLCVAYANSGQYQLANQACDQAIELSRTAVAVNSQAQRIVALALNNRAVYKTKIQDYDGALQDLMEASEIRSSAIIEGNLLKLIQQQADFIQFKPLQVTQA